MLDQSATTINDGWVFDPAGTGKGPLGLPLSFSYCECHTVLPLQPGITSAHVHASCTAGRIAAIGGFADLAPFIRNTPEMQWSDFNKFYREVSRD